MTLSSAHNSSWLGRFHVSLLSFVSLASLSALAIRAAATQEPLPLWDMQRLSAAPRAEFGARAGLVQEVRYEGEPFNGKPTRVFSYYARPDGKGPFPGMVLVHGGGGTAFKDWAVHWAKRGYAAIAMDLAGRSPTGQSPDGGPDQSDETKFRQFDESDARNMWTYHAVSAAIRAHSLIASLPEVDRSRIGVTGISWGGYLTSIIAGVDHRFKVAVPVYGCGFLHENSVWKANRIDPMPAELRESWVRLFDPSSYLPKVRCPILFLNGTNDFAYPMDSYKRSYESVRAPRSISVQIRLPHGHIWTFPIVDAFVDSVLAGGLPLPKLGRMVVRDGTASVTVEDGARLLLKAHLYFTADTGRWQERKWESLPARIEGNKVLADLPKDRPLTLMLAVTDSQGNIVTSQHEIVAVGR